jgi:hypothetical protein
MDTGFLMHARIILIRVDESATAQLHAVDELFSSNVIAFVRRPNP